MHAHATEIILEPSSSKYKTFISFFASTLKEGRAGPSAGTTFYRHTEDKDIVQPWYQLHVSSARTVSSSYQMKTKHRSFIPAHLDCSWNKLTKRNDRNIISQETQQSVSTAFLDQETMLQKPEVLQNRGLWFNKQLLPEIFQKKKCRGMLETLVSKWLPIVSCLSEFYGRL